MRWNGRMACVLGATLWFAQPAAASEIAEAAMQGDAERVHALIERQVDVNAAQVDGATALHWAVHQDELAMAALLIEAGADPMAANRLGATPLKLAAINGNAEMIALLLGAGADPNAPVTHNADTPLMMAARTGVPAAVQVLLEHGAEINARERWGATTPLMWAVAEGHSEVARLLLEAGAEVDARTVFIPPDTGRGFEGAAPRERRDEEVGPVQHAGGELTALMMAAREGHLETARVLVEAGADIDARAADGKDSLSLAIFNGNYDFATYLIEQGAAINQTDARGFTALFWAVDRRNMETAPNFPWMITEDPLPLIKKLLDAGADPNQLVNDTPRARMRGGNPRIVFATPLMRAAFSADLELVELLLEYGADPHILSSDNETMLGAAAGTGFVPGYHKERSRAERLEILRLFVEEYGLDVNWHDDYGITPLMVAANLGYVELLEYLVEQGADPGAYDLGKKNDGAFGASVEPLQAIDYAIGVGTFRPNDAVVFNTEAVEYLQRVMQERGIAHTTSECTLRGFTCSAVAVDPRYAFAAEIARARTYQIGHQVEEGRGRGLTIEEDACLEVNVAFGGPSTTCVDEEQ